MIGSESSDGGSSTTSWHGPEPTTLGRESAIDFSFPSARILPTKPSGGVISSTSETLRAEVVEPLDAERHAHPPLGPELVDEERHGRAAHVPEEERRAAGLRHAVRDLGDLEVRVDLGRHLDELAVAAQVVEPVAEVREGHRGRRV